MQRHLRPVLLLALLALIGETGAVVAQESDPHRLYERSCGNCHTPHAGDFVHESIDYRDDTLFGRKSGRSVRAFLEGGHGRLTADEVEVILDHLTRIQLSGQVYRKKCNICHDRAVQLARRKLILRDSVLMGRYTGRDIEQFLFAHGRLTAEEVPKMVDILEYQLRSLPQ